MKIYAVSDLHGFLPPIPDCDLLLIGGDVCPMNDHSPEYQGEWLNDEFRNWLNDIPAKQVVGVAGNHDFVFERRELVPGDLRWIYLEDESAECCGLKIFGSPMVRHLFNWAFFLPAKQAVTWWDKIPDDTDVLIVHGPPYGYGDRVLDGYNVGCEFLARRIARLSKLKLVVTGHIHEGRGSYKLGSFHIFNVSHCDAQYNKKLGPVLIPLEN